jgi:hypothetical protein
MFSGNLKFSKLSKKLQMSKKHFDTGTFFKFYACQWLCIGKMYILGENVFEKFEVFKNIFKNCKFQKKTSGTRYDFQILGLPLD